ncbi:MAG: phospho-N-acetylmuramoyl-pentapeptide-transferase [Acidimicrobiia bacterium]
MVRLLLAAGIAMAVSLAASHFLVRWFKAKHIGQPIHEDVPDGHIIKAGTPTMGGIGIVLSLLVAYFFTNMVRGTYTRTGLIIVFTIAGAGFVGFLDDWIKVRSERNLGLSKRAKSVGLLVVAVSFIVLMLAFTNVSTTLSFTRAGQFGIDLGSAGWAVWALLLIVGSTNAVNLTDGLDGLAAGSAILGFFTFLVIGFWGFRNTDFYGYSHALDLAVIAAAMVGACTGFLWWNAAPARIIMGDTGSLAIGAAFATLALANNTQLLLPIIGGLYVMETVSVILQVGSFRLTGKRIFRMSPIHHHFELLGWPESTIFVRFWILAGLSSALALGCYYADFLSSTGLGELVVGS